MKNKVTIEYYEGVDVADVSLSYDVDKDGRFRMTGTIQSPNFFGLFDEETFPINNLTIQDYLIRLKKSLGRVISNNEGGRWKIGHYREFSEN